MSTLFDTSSIVMVPDGAKATKLYSIKPTDGSGDFLVTRATTATRVNAAGLVETVAANVPRIDYAEGGCPSLLIEPQRTNLCLQSASFDTAPWGVVSSATIDADVAVSPDGGTNADRLNMAAISGSRVEQTVTVTSGQTYTYTVWVKSESGSVSDVRVLLGGVTGADASITITETWQKIVVTGTATLTTAFPQIRNNTASAKSILVWGAQVELGSYATSYIPTVASTVTRNADEITKSGIAALLGQTEGAFSFEASWSEFNNNGFALSQGVSTNRAVVYATPAGVLNFVVTKDGATQAQVIGASISLNTYVKVAVSYIKDDFKMYLNGVSQGTNTSGDVATSGSLTNIIFSIGGTSNYFYGRIKLFTVYQTALLPSELATLTT